MFMYLTTCIEVLRIADIDHDQITGERLGLFSLREIIWKKKNFLSRHSLVVTIVRDKAHPLARSCAFMQSIWDKNNDWTFLS